jgi:putative aldouronate transport system substrate-binding protein
MFNVEAFRELARQSEIYSNAQYLFYTSTYGTGTAKRSGIYQAHPELRYTMVGPLNWADGSPGTQLETAGRTGTPILAFPRTNRYLDQTLNFLNYVNTKEGKELIRYGIEGQTFIRNAQGQPRIHPSIYAARQRGDPNWQSVNGYNLAGLGTVGRVDWANLSMEWFGERNAWSSLTDEPEWIEFQKMKPIEQVPGYPISALSPQFPEIETLNRLDLTNSEKTWRERAYFAPTEAAARQILADFQNWVRTQENGVFMRYLNFMTQQARTRNDLAF